MRENVERDMPKNRERLMRAMRESSEKENFNEREM